MRVKKRKRSVQCFVRLVGGKTGVEASIKRNRAVAEKTRWRILNQPGQKRLRAPSSRSRASIRRSRRGRRKPSPVTPPERAALTINGGEDKTVSFQEKKGERDRSCPTRRGRVVVRQEGKAGSSDLSKKGERTETNGGGS